MPKFLIIIDNREKMAVLEAVIGFGLIGLESLGKRIEKIEELRIKCQLAKEINATS
jgi:hypothetical protein